MTAYERTGWRDESISKRHRTWGFNCPAVDLDFLMVEYNLGKPVGVVEYKHNGAATPNIKHPTYRALIELCDLAELPFMIVFYDNSDWWFRVYPINGKAKTVFVNAELMSEAEYVTRLYEMRSRTIEQVVLTKLSTYKPEALPGKITQKNF